MHLIVILVAIGIVACANHEPREWWGVIKGGLMPIVWAVIIFILIILMFIGAVLSRWFLSMF